MHGVACTEYYKPMHDCDQNYFCDSTLGLSVFINYADKPPIILFFDCRQLVIFSLNIILL